MQKNKKLRGKITEKKFCSSSRKIAVLAIVGVIILFGATLLAINNYPHYVFTGQFLSELGIGSTALIFNAGLVIGAVFLIPFFVSLYKKHSFISQLNCFLGVASMIFLAGVGVFPMKVGSLHFVCATMFFFLISLVVLFAWISYMAGAIKTKSKNYTKFFLFAVLSLFTLASTVLLALSLTPLLQKMSAIGVLIWILFFAITKIFEKRN